MKNSIPSSIVLAALMLALAAHVPLAVDSLDCVYHLEQNPDGLPTRVRFGNDIYKYKWAFLRPQDKDIWTAFVANGDSYITSDQTGFSETSSFLNMSEREECYINMDLEWELTGIVIDGQEGKVSFDKTRALFVNINETSTGTYKITGNYEYDEDFAILIANGSDFGFSHIFYQHNTGVILIDDKCNEVEVVPLSKLEPRLQVLLMDGLGATNRSEPRAPRSRSVFRSQRARAHLSASVRWSEVC